MDGVGQHLLQLLREDACLVAGAVDLVVAGERRVVLIPHDADLIDIVQLAFGVELANVVLNALVARLDDVAGDFDVPVHDETLVGHVGVDANLALVEDRVLRDAALPTAQVHVALELTGVGGPDDDSFARVTDDWVVAGEGVRVQPHDQLEVALLGVRPALLAHVVARRLREVEAPDGDLADLPVLEIDAKDKKVRTIVHGRVVRQLTAPDRTASSSGPTVIVRCELSALASPA